MKIERGLGFVSFCKNAFFRSENLEVPAGTEGVVLHQKFVVVKGETQTRYIVFIPASKDREELVLQVNPSLLTFIARPVGFAMPPNSVFDEHCELKQIKEKRWCPACNRVFSNDEISCPNDGFQIISFPALILKFESLKTKSGDVFQPEKLIFSGSQSFVFSAARASDGKQFAVKASAESHLCEQLKAEAEILSRVSHPSIVKLLNSGEIDDGKNFFFVMELLSAGDFLIDRISEITPSETKRTLQGIAGALEYLHALGKVYPRLTPSEIHVAGERAPAILIDFGEARTIGHVHGTYSENGIFGGDLSTLAPEIVMNKTNLPASNIYSLAAILFHCLAKRPVFPRRKRDTASQAIAVLGSLPPRLSDLTESAKELHPRIEEIIYQCLSKEPELRPGMNVLKWAIDQLPD